MPPEVPTQTPAPAPAPAPADPFAGFAQPTPAPAPEPQPAPAPAPTEPAPQPQPTPPAPTEPIAPNPEPPVQPTEPVQPTPQPQPQPTNQQDPQAPQYQTFDEYMDSILGGMPQPTKAPELKDVNPDDPAAIQQFFTQWGQSIVDQAAMASRRESAIQSAEKRGWDELFDKYPSTRTKDLRDTIHNIRMGNFQRGIAMTPLQAAESLLRSMNHQYRQGVADSAVVTTIQDTQPVNGGHQTPQETSLTKEQELLAVQNGGEQALAQILDAQIKAGTL